MIPTSSPTHALSRRVAAVALTVLSVLGVLAGALAVDTATAPPAEAVVNNNDELQLLEKLNATRVFLGARPLAWSDGVAAGGRSWAASMRDRNTLGHDPNFGRAVFSVIPDASRAGENVGFGGDATVLHNAFMNSPLHRDNMLNPAFTRVGIGSVRGPDGRMWVTVRFAASPTLGTESTPFGNFESAGSPSAGKVRLSGWALDPDVSASSDVHLYVDGQWGGAFTANTVRSDVGSAYAGYGNNHGFDFTIGGQTTGSHNYCLYAINMTHTYGPNVLLGCRAVYVANTSSPFGNVEAVTYSGPKTVTLSGWTLDPDTAASIDVHLYVNGAGSGAFTANLSRPDVGAAYPGYGNLHGFSVSAGNQPVGTNTYCLYAIDKAGGNNHTLLTCTPVTVRDTAIGVADSISSPAAGRVRVAGWALDYDTASAIAVRVTIDGKIVGTPTAAAPRPDLAAHFPGWGTNHGFDATYTAAPGSRQVCVTALNATGTTGASPQLRCATVTVG
jgi:uncharacterized protein YkwD